jgi:hypothetical protein
VLDGEQCQQRDVDDHRRRGEGAVADAAPIDALADDMHTADHEVGVGDEPDGVEEDGQEKQVATDAIGAIKTPPAELPAGREVLLAACATT